MTVASPTLRSRPLWDVLTFVALAIALDWAIGLLPIHSREVGLTHVLEVAAALILAALGVWAVRRFRRQPA